MSTKIEAAMRAVGIDEKIISDIIGEGIDDGEIEYFQGMAFDEFKTEFIPRNVKMKALDGKMEALFEKIQKIELEPESEEEEEESVAAASVAAAAAPPPTAPSPRAHAQRQGQEYYIDQLGAWRPLNPAERSVFDGWDPEDREVEKEGQRKARMRLRDDMLKKRPDKYSGEGGEDDEDDAGSVGAQIDEDEYEDEGKQAHTDAKIAEQPAPQEGRPKKTSRLTPTEYLMALGWTLDECKKLEEMITLQGRELTVKELQGQGTEAISELRTQLSGETEPQPETQPEPQAEPLAQPEPAAVEKAGRHVATRALARETVEAQAKAQAEREAAAEALSSAKAELAALRDEYPHGIQRQVEGQKYIGVKLEQGDKWEVTPAAKGGGKRKSKKRKKRKSKRKKSRKSRKRSKTRRSR